MRAKIPAHRSYRRGCSAPAEKRPAMESAAFGRSVLSIMSFSLTSRDKITEPETRGNQKYSKRIDNKTYVENANADNW
jgi:hypothetical protein